MIYILHHGNCPDGFGAAWAAYKYFETKRAAEYITYIPVLYDQPLPDMPELNRNSIVYILDFSYDSDTLIKLAEQVDLVRVIDHHLTAQKKLEKYVAWFMRTNPGKEVPVIVDTSKSGAVLAWEYFHPQKPVPDILKYVQDRDLRQWQLVDSKEINLALSARARSFVNWNAFIDNSKIHILIEEGKAILQYVEKQVENLAEHVNFVYIDNWTRVPVVNTALFQSEVGEYLIDKYPDAPFAMTRFQRSDGKWQHGLRSRGEFDVSEIAEKMGGGGHKHAAGFVTTCVTDRYKNDKN